MNKVNSFFIAKPIWAKSLENEKFITLGLYTKTMFNGKSLFLKIATSGNYRLFVNNEFCYCGPARAAHNYFRVDEINLSHYKGELNIAIEVVNYGVGSFSDLRQSGFIEVEIVADSNVVAATGDDCFDYYLLNERVRRVQRYSFQRPMAESYKLTPGMYNWRMGETSPNAVQVETTVYENKNLIVRNIDTYKFPVIKATSVVAEGEIANGIKPDNYFKDRSLIRVIEPPNKTPEGYAEEHLAVHLTDEVQEMKTLTLNKVDSEYAGTTNLVENQFEIISYPCEKTGFLFMDINCTEKGALYVLFDEILNDGDVDPLRLHCCNVIRLDVEKGEYRFQSAQALGMQYIKIVCTSGKFIIKNIGMYELMCPHSIISEFHSDNKKHNTIYEAAKETFKQNSVDIFMDCPTRERAGYLCDSYFTAKAEHYFTGANKTEHNFLENYLLPEKFKDVPEGMVPMCYPADHWDNQYIPNWALWLILELADYRARNGDVKLILCFKNRVYGILDWFKKYENTDGLLERLPGWVFVEWSKANDLVQDINFPTNMLYAYALEKVSDLYDDKDLLIKAENLKVLIRKRSFNGEFFCDNEVYFGDKPQLSGITTETCQYYAFFTGIATQKLYPELWQTLVKKFGPDRKKNGLYPKVHPSNAFIGNFLRLYLLDDNGYYEQLLNEIEGYFFYMAERTGTLWEHDDVYASCNHGFASYVAVLLSKAYRHLYGT